MLDNWKQQADNFLKDNSDGLESVAKDYLSIFEDVLRSDITDLEIDSSGNVKYKINKDGEEAQEGSLSFA